MLLRLGRDVLGRTVVSAPGVEVSFESRTRSEIFGRVNGRSVGPLPVLDLGHVDVLAANEVKVQAELVEQHLAQMAVLDVQVRHAVDDGDGQVDEEKT